MDQTQPTVETTELATTESQPVETTAVETETTESKVDWWNPDTWGKTPPKEVMKQIQTQFNEKAEKAKKADSLEKDYQVARAELERIANDTRAALADPKVYREYRKKLGYETGVETPEPALDFTKMETVGDVVDSFNKMKTYYDSKLAELERTTELRAENKIRQAVDPIAKERWSVALDTMKTKYGDKFSNVERKIVSAITAGQYQYSPGQEKELLDKVFRAEAPEEYNSFLMDSLKQKAETKAKQTTAAPRPTVPRVPSKGNTADDIVKRVQARLGPAR